MNSVYKGGSSVYYVLGKVKVWNLLRKKLKPIFLKLHIHKHVLIMACCCHVYYYGIILHLVSGQLHFYLYLRYFINYLCFILYMYFCDSIWSFTYITFILTLFYVWSYTCISVTVIVYAIYINVILCFVLYMYFCGSNYIMLIIFTLFHSPSKFDLIHVFL